MPDLTEPFLMRKTHKVPGDGPEYRGAEVRVFLPLRLAAELTEDQARERAWRIFKRDRPAENPMSWEIVTE